MWLSLSYCFHNFYYCITKSIITILFLSIPILSNMSHFLSGKSYFSDLFRNSSKPDIFGCSGFPLLAEAVNREKTYRDVIN